MRSKRKNKCSYSRLAGNIMHLLSLNLPLWHASWHCNIATSRALRKADAIKVSVGQPMSNNLKSVSMY